MKRLPDCDYHDCRLRGTDVVDWVFEAVPEWGIKRSTARNTYCHDHAEHQVGLYPHAKVVAFLDPRGRGRAVLAP